MKSKFLIFSLFAICVFSNTASRAQVKDADKEIRTMLKEFYTIYITEEYKDGLEDSIKKKYCTKKILNRIKQDEELENDPFVNAQDYDLAWLKTLTINKDSQKENVYTVSFISSYDQKKTIIRLLVVKDGQRYKIDNILSY